MASQTTSHSLILTAVALLSCSSPRSPATPHWLIGSWTAPAFDGVLRETWRGEGSVRLVKSGYYIEGSDTLYSEEVRIDSRFDGIYLIAQPKGGRPVIFRLVQESDSIVTFHNPGNYNPYEVTYQHLGQDRFVRTTTGVEGDDTVQNRFEFFRDSSADSVLTGRSHAASR